jgi:hypothetical protein
MNLKQNFNFYLIPIFYNYFENIMIYDKLKNKKENKKEIKHKEFKICEFDRIIFKNYMNI